MMYNNPGTMKTLLIKNGMAVTENTETVCDILCEDGKIAQIGKDISPAA